MGCVFKSVLQLAAIVIITPLASATSVVIVPDEILVEQADLIIRGTVLAVTPAPVAGRTDILVTPTRVLKGSAGPTVTMRVVGGGSSGDMALRIVGAPMLEPGDETLLFLRSSEEQVHHPLHLMLGVFHLSGNENHGYAVRDLDRTAIVSIDGIDTPDEGLLRERRSFESWIVARVAGESPAPDYRSIPSAFQPIWEPFTLFQSPSTGKNIRWFDFDEGRSVSWSINPPEFSVASPSIAQLQNAITVWNQAPGTDIRYVAAGETNATAGLSAFDGINAVVFGDPNDEVDETFSCVTGGVLAIGGPWFNSSTFPFRDRVVHRAAGADVVFNDGVECLSLHATALKDFEEVMGHELGHTLGIAHSCGDAASGNCQPGTAQNGALMRATAHLDGRGAVLNSDDLAAAVELYPDLATTPNFGRRRSVSRP